MNSLIVFLFLLYVGEFLIKRLFIYLENLFPPESWERYIIGVSLYIILLLYLFLIYHIVKRLNY